MTNSIFSSLLKLQKKNPGANDRTLKNYGSVKQFAPLHNLTTHDIFTIAVVIVTIIVVLAYAIGG
jgi:hypothetical protein